ncbi:hypothetical protein FK216_12570 [Moraxellaceae bacterium AER2_44_116]|nr:hypothetical protein FK216_12570 [Moraxellaceae bacterium AER2_44_116]
MSRLVVQLLCLLSYLWTSTCLGNALLVNQLIQQDPHPQIIVMDAANDSLIVHHKGHRDQHEPQAQDNRQASNEHEHSDHVVKLVCVDHDQTWLAAKPPLNKVQVADTLWAYLPPPVVTYTTTAKTLLLAQQPPPLSRNSSLAIVQLTRLRI